MKGLVNMTIRKIQIQKIGGYGRCTWNQSLFKEHAIVSPQFKKVWYSDLCSIPRYTNQSHSFKNRRFFMGWSQLIGQQILKKLKF
jgi:hypothetical protein